MSNERTQQLHDLGQSLWLDNITRDDARRRHASSGYIDELSVTGLTRTRRSSTRRSAGGDAYDEQIVELAGRARHEETLLRARARRPAPTPPSCSRRPRAHRRRRRLRLARGLAAARRRRRGDDRAGGEPARAGAAATTSSSRSPARGRAARDRGDDLRRHPGQRHAAVLARAVPRRRRCLLRGIERRIAAGPRPRRGLGRLAVHQPLGRRGRRQDARRSCGTSSGSPSASRPTPPTASCSPPTLAAPRRTRAPGRSACSGPAPAPRTRRSPTSSTSRRSPRRTRSTRCPRRRCRPSPTTARSASRCRPTAATPRRSSRPTARPGSTPTRLPRLQAEGAESFNKSWHELMGSIASKRERLGSAA